MSGKFLLVCGAVVGAVAVCLGAFGAHWLRGAVERWGLAPDEQARSLEVWDVAVRYQMYHALALLGVGILATMQPCKTLMASGILFLVGIVIFSGFLYALVLTGIKVLGAIVPIGGVAFILGWLALALAVLRR